jgi:hypothetical protein
VDEFQNLAMSLSDFITATCSNHHFEERSPALWHQNAGHATTSFEA